MSTSQKRSELMSRVARATTHHERMAAADAVREFDERQKVAHQEAKSLDWADTVVKQAMSPVAVHERSTVDTDWLDDFVPQGEASRHTALAEAGMWFEKVSNDVKADPEEFGIQAEGFMRREASRYGEQAQEVLREGLDYIGHRYRQHLAASGLDQIQQTYDGHDNPKSTPLPTEVFDNYAPEVDPINEAVQGTEESDRAPMLQTLMQQNQGMTPPETVGGHWETPDFPSPYSNPPTGENLDMSSGPQFGAEQTPAAPNGPDDLVRQALAEGPSVAHVGHGMTVDDFRHIAASGLDQVQQVTDAHDNYAPTAMPNQVMFPWMLSEDQQQELAQKQVQQNDESSMGTTAMYRQAGFFGDIAGDLGGEIKSTMNLVNPGGSAMSDIGKGDFNPADWMKDQVHDTLNSAPAHMLGDAAQMAQGGPILNMLSGGTLARNPQKDMLKSWDSNMGGLAKTAPTTPSDSGSSGSDSSGDGSGSSSDSGSSTLGTDGLGSAGDTGDSGSSSGSDGGADPTGQTDGGAGNTGSDPISSLTNTGMRYTADMFGGSDAPHATAQPWISNGTYSNPYLTNPSYQSGQQDAQNPEAAPTYADASSAIDPAKQQYAKGYSDANQGMNGQANDRPGVPNPSSPSSMGGTPSGQQKASALLMRSASKQITSSSDFRKGYGFASKWSQGKRLVRAGSVAFETGLLAGMIDRPARVRDQWRTAHLQAGGEFAGRAQSQGEYVSYLYRQAATSADNIVSSDPQVSASPTGQTPINGPGTVPILDGQKDINAPAGPAPYNGAEPYGSPVVPTDKVPMPPQPVINTPGGLSPQTQAFRNQVQSSLARSARKA